MNSTLITTQFHSTANHLLFRNYEEVKAATVKINRGRNEEEFQQLVRHFLNKLKQEMESAAGDLLHQYATGERTNALNLRLGTLIQEYLHQFRQKMKDL